MKKNLKYLFFILVMISNVIPSSSIKSLIFPGWGEMNEFNILSKTEKLDNIDYIKERSNKIMFVESAIWIALFTAIELHDSYKNNYIIYGTTNAGVDWTNKTDLFAANVGNYKSFTDYNDYKSRTSPTDMYQSGQGYEWDWQSNDSKRLKYDTLRNKSEKADKVKTYMVASLFINRIISTFDVLSIKLNHGRIMSFDVENDSNDLKLNLNYTF